MVGDEKESRQDQAGVIAGSKHKGSQVILIRQQTGNWKVSIIAPYKEEVR